MQYTNKSVNNKHLLSTYYVSLPYPLKTEEQVNFLNSSLGPRLVIEIIHLCCRFISLFFALAYLNSLYLGLAVIVIVL